MKAHVGRSDAGGTVRVPGSKSYTIRALMCAAMADGESAIEGALESDDTTAARDCLELLGTEFRDCATGISVCGGRLHEAQAPLWCNESGATFRFGAALAATVPATTVLRCAPSLSRRPLQPLIDALQQLDARCEFDASAGTLVVHGRSRRSGRVFLRGDVSSQFLSALLLSGPRFAGGLSVNLSSPVVSGRYVDMTVDCMRRFGAVVDASGDGFRVRGGGYRPTHYVVEGDWSGAAAVLALGAVAGDVVVTQLYPTSLQADVAMLDLLRTMGVTVSCRDGEVMVRRAALSPCISDLSGAIDLLPVACSLAAVADGETTMTGIARARDKESDRVAAMAGGLARLGVRVDVGDDEMRIWGGTAHGGTVSSVGDHRIAMAFGVLGAVVGDVVIDGAECVSKTYPGFWDMLAGLGVEVTLDE